MKNQLIILMLLFLGAKESFAQQKIARAYLKQEVEVYLPNGSKMVNAMDIFIKDGQVRTESKQGPMSSIMLYSDADKTLVTLTDMRGVKEGRVSQNSVKVSNDISMEYLNEEKSLLGYSCKKAIVKTTKSGTIEQRTVWYLPDRVLSFVYDFGIAGLNKVNGLPLEYENVFNGIKMVHRVVELDFNKQIEDELFKVPNHYKLK